MSLSGSIEDLPLLEILQVVSFCQKTGHLVVRAPEGDAGVVFRDGPSRRRLRLGPPAVRRAAGRATATRRCGPGSPLSSGRSCGCARASSRSTSPRRCRRGSRAATSSGETLEYGINPEELMLDLARKLDEERRDCAAVLEASFVAPVERAATRRPTASPAPPSSRTPRRSRRPTASWRTCRSRTWPSRSCRPRRRRRPCCSSTTSRTCGASWASRLEREGLAVVAAGVHRRGPPRAGPSLGRRAGRCVLAVDLGLPSESGTHVPRRARRRAPRVGPPARRRPSS